jgi:hypothetical protein
VARSFDDVGELPCARLLRWIIGDEPGELGQRVVELWARVAVRDQVAVRQQVLDLPRLGDDTVGVLDASGTVEQQQ